MIPLLETERLIIRGGNAADVKAIAAYYARNRDYLAPFEPLRPETFFTAAHWDEQLRKNDDEFRQGLSVRFFIFLKARPAEVAGSVTLNAIIRAVFQACYLGYSLDERLQGQGYMTEALRVIIGYAFAPPVHGGLNLHRIMANHLPDNERSARLLQKLGFEVEGLAKQYLLINGQWRDHVLTALINQSATR